MPREFTLSIAPEYTKRMLEEARKGLRETHMPRPMMAFAVLAIVYIILGLALPPNTPTVEAYHLTTTEYRVLVLILNIPILVVWLAAFYGYEKLDEYLHLVRKTPNGASLNDVSTGLKFLAWGLPVTSIIAVTLAGISHSVPSMANFSLITTHYLSLIVALFAFSYIGFGSNGLATINHVQPTANTTRWIFATFTLFGVLFTYATVVAGQDRHPNPFRLPIWIILLTIVAPYLYAWLMGLFAAIQIFLYSAKTKGVLYKQALMYLSAGIVVTIVSSVALQLLMADTTHIRRISFSITSIEVYLLLLLFAGGFLLISSGAKRLKKIEEV